MIPKVIHYCWFGGKPLPKEYENYIDSWRRYLPGYEIKRWNETNYDVNCVPFSAEAYSVGKYAFVSDYARLKILYENGGVYFDTDVEVIRPMDDILERGGFMGFEKNTNALSGDLLFVALGLGFAVEPGNRIIKEVLDYYDSRHFIHQDGSYDQTTIVVIVTEILKKYGLKRSDIPQTVEGITIYPWDYFCPIEFMSSKLEITENTHTIHHFSASWMTWRDRLRIRIGYYIAKIKKLFGVKTY